MYDFPFSVSIADHGPASRHRKPGQRARAGALPRQLIALAPPLLLSAGVVPHAPAAAPTVNSLIHAGPATTRPNVSDVGLRTASEAGPTPEAPHDFGLQRPRAAHSDEVARPNADAGIGAGRNIRCLDPPTPGIDGIPRRVEQAARRFRQAGLPMIHMWQGSGASLSAGLSPRGLPGVYFIGRLN